MFERVNMISVTNYGLCKDVSLSIMYITFTKYTKRTKFGGYRNFFFSSVCVF